MKEALVPQSIHTHIQIFLLIQSIWYILRKGKKNARYVKKARNVINDQQEKESLEEKSEITEIVKLIRKIL